MKKLDSLIKLYQHQLDDKKRQLTDMNALAARLTESLTALEAEISAERTLSNNTVENMRAFQAYMVGAAQRRQKLEDSIEQLEMQILEVTDDIAESFQELKRVEITKATHEKQYWDTVNRKDQATQDDISLQQHRRNRR
jgi:flagellar export protein FliJ